MLATGAAPETWKWNSVLAFAKVLLLRLLLFMCATGLATGAAPGTWNGVLIFAEELLLRLLLFVYVLKVENYECEK